MRTSTKKVINRWKKHARKIKNKAKRTSLIFMVDAIENRIKMNGKELGE